jgi:hypothetical protein
MKSRARTLEKIERVGKGSALALCTRKLAAAVRGQRGERPINPLERAKDPVRRTDLAPWHSSESGAPEAAWSTRNVRQRLTPATPSASRRFLR